VLLAKLAGAMKANLSKAAGLFNAPASQVARLAAALQEKRAAEEPAAPAEAPAEAPAPQAPAAEAPAAEAAEAEAPAAEAAETESTE
jgi:large subunit ribosomal protein L10